MTIARETHKDQIVGDRFAQALAQQLQCTVCVSCGIHYGSPGPEGLRQIVHCTETLLTQLFLKI